MKQLLTLIALTATLCSCGESNNDKMNTLLSEKKQSEDSLSHYKNNEAFYEGKFRSAEDTIIGNLYLDTFSTNNLNATITEARLKEINYSIDSLGKLK